MKSVVTKITDQLEPAGLAPGGERIEKPAMSSKSLQAEPSPPFRQLRKPAHVKTTISSIMESDCGIEHLPPLISWMR